MKKSFADFATQSFKKIIQSPKLIQLLQTGQEFLLENKTQLIITAGLLTTLAIMNKGKEDEKEGDNQLEKDIDKQDVENLLQTSSSNADNTRLPLTRPSFQYLLRPDEDTEKTNIDRNLLNEELKKSQKQLNRKINKNMKIKGMLGPYKADRTFEDSSDDQNNKSQDFSVVSDLDQKFFADHFSNKKKSKRNYQTDYDSDNCLTFLKQKRNHMLKIAKEQKSGNDKLFFKLYAQVAEQENQEDEDD